MPEQPSEYGPELIEQLQTSAGPSDGEEMEIRFAHKEIGLAAPDTRPLEEIKQENRREQA